MAVEMTQNSNGNNKLKKWREVKIIENEHICKNLIWCIFFNFRHISPKCPSVFITDFDQVNTRWEG